MKMCEQIIKKRQRPNSGADSLNCKNHDANSSRYRFAAINKNNSDHAKVKKSSAKRSLVK